MNSYLVPISCLHGWLIEPILNWISVVIIISSVYILNRYIVQYICVLVGDW